MKAIRALCALAVLLLGACASTNPMLNPVADQTLPPPPADKAQIVFINPGNAVAAAFLSGVYDIKGDNKELFGMLGSKTRLVKNVDPGQHLFMANTLANSHLMEADVQAGKRYYVAMRFIYGRGMQLRPIRATGNGEFSADSAQFKEWKTGSALVEKTPDADAWFVRFKSMVDEAQAKAMTEWKGKDASQKAELTLNSTDFLE